MKPEEKLRYARTVLTVSSPFFGTLALNTPVYFRKPEESPIPTAWTDGLNVYFNTAFADSLTREEFTAVYMHELLHIAFLHVPRRYNRKPQKWNVAADYAINWIIAQEAERVRQLFGSIKFQLPKDALLDKNFANMSAEQIYAVLPDDEFEGGGGGSGGGGGGQDTTHGDILQEDVSASNSGAVAEVMQRVAAAAQAAKLRGSIPAGVDRLVEEVLNPPLDWRRELAAIVEHFPADFTFNPPDRRFHDYDFVVPSLGGDKVEVVLAFDTSGSIGDDELKLYLSEAYGILNQFDHVKVRVIMCDAAVHLDEEYEGQAVKFNFKGGGGTDFRPVFERLEETETPRALVYFTDGYGVFPDEPPSYPVLWVLTPNSIDPNKVPFGKVVKLTE